ncbi:MAG: hypothetical protein AAF563_04700 [Pseudomonadota bacterium]
MTKSLDALKGPYGTFAVVTPNDSSDFAAGVTHALYVGGAGDVVVHGTDGEPAMFVGVPAGTLLPVSVARVLATGTSATSILALRI